MQTLVFVLMLLVCFNFMLKQTYCKPVVTLTVSAACALFVGGIWPYAIEQSKTQIADWLANPELMLDTAVILSIEVGINMAFCMLATHLMTSGNLPRRTLFTYRLLRFFPGLLIFPVLFSALVAVIFSFPGTSFSALSWIMALMVFISIPTGTWVLRWMLPEKELRLEVLFLTNAATGILGILATVNGKTAVSGISEVNWGALLGLIVILLIGGLAGMLIFHYRLKKMINK